eukprot:COSAG06_NODE_531_length_14564_cov_23.708400_6_plen_66_part_00
MHPSMCSYLYVVLPGKRCHACCVDPNGELAAGALCVDTGLRSCVTLLLITLGPIVFGWVNPETCP